MKIGRTVKDRERKIDHGCHARRTYTHLHTRAQTHTHTHTNTQFSVVIT